jgi:DNA N-6-adenine-methyltransferase (Dam)
VRQGGEPVSELAQVRPAQLRSGELLEQARRALAEIETLPDLAALVDRIEVIRVAARKTKAARRIQNDWAELKLRGQRRGGEMVDEVDRHRPEDGRPKALHAETHTRPTLVELGLGETAEAARLRAFRWREIAAVPGEAFESYIARVADPEHDGEDEITTAGLMASVQTWETGGLRLSTENEWYTPPRYLAAVREVIGGIDLDPASSEAANQVVKATRILTKHDDGLAQPWHGRVFLNPPYGRLAGDFVIKLVEEYRAGNVTAAVALVNAHCTDTDWFQPLWDHALCFTDHRIDFDSAGRAKMTTSTHGSVFVHLGHAVDHPDQFARVFGQFGAVVRRWRL